jgi:predicted secreted protein
MLFMRWWQCEAHLNSQESDHMHATNMHQKTSILLTVFILSAAATTATTVVNAQSSFGLKDLLKKAVKDAVPVAKDKVPEANNQTTTSVNKVAPEATIEAASTNLRYAISADGHEVTDKETNLIWRRCAAGMSWSGTTCSGTASVVKSVVRAFDQVKKESANGVTWRMPTYDELKGLARIEKNFDLNVGILGIDATVFPATPAAIFWSSTLYYKDRGDRDRTKTVYFNVGATSADSFLDNGDEGVVRLVRDAGTSAKQNATLAANTRKLSAEPAIAGVRFVVSANGQEVTDQNNGLIWRRCPEGMTATANKCSGAAATFDYNEALNRAMTQAKATKIQWRLPDANELYSIAIEGRKDVAIDTTFFPGTPPDYFWTSFKESPEYSKSINFYNSFVYSRYHTSKHYVRLVRGGTPVEAPAFK